jgi:proteasome lid subunit RPN8/RPN11
MALHISRKVLDQVLARACGDHPIETCGIVASAAQSNVASRIVPMRNQAASETFFSFDSREQFRVFRELSERGEVCRVIYHSHTATEAYPSREDVAHAGDPDAHYLIVSTWDQARVPLRGFRLIRGHIVEENIVVHDA